jgi:hypothetical protein
MSQLGFGGSNQNSRKLIKLSIEEKVASLNLMDKVNDKWTPIQKENELTGYLEDVKLSTYTHKRGESMQLSLYMDLGEFKAMISSNLNSLAKEILNRFSNYDNLNGALIKFRVFTNKAGYPAIAVYMNGDNMEWGVKGEDFKTNFNNEDFWVSVFETKILPQFNSAVVNKETQKDLDEFITNTSEEIPF